MSFIKAGRDGIVVRDQTLPFMFEVMDNVTQLPEKHYILPINPEIYRKSHLTRTSINQTQAGAFENNIGMGIPKISIQGTFGYLGSLIGGHGRHIEQAKKDGWGLYKELEETFLSFYEGFGTYKSNGKPVTEPVDSKNPPDLRFFDYTDRDYFIVQLNKFELNRSIQRRMLYQYDIQLTVLRRLDEPSITEDSMVDRMKMLADLEKVQKKLSLWEKALKLYTSVSTSISSIINQIHAIQQKIATVVQAVKAFRQGLTDFIKAPFALIRDCISAVRSISQTVSSLSNLPHEFLHELRETERALYSYSTKPQLFNATNTSSAASTSASTSVYEIATAPLPKNPAFQALGIVAMDTPETTLFDPSNEQVSDVVVKQVSIKDSDTIETIAAKELGDASQWGKIALVNNLEYPFIVKENSLDAYSPALGSRTLAAEASGDTLNLPGLSPKAREVLVLNNNGVLTAVTVESVNGDSVKLTQPLSSTFPPGITVTRHEKALSVLAPGKKIQIPGDSTTAIAVANGDDPDFYNKIYGTDEALDDEGMHAADSSGDVESVSGMDNLIMQLQHRLMTTRGELARLGHPDYGSYLPKIIGKIGSSLWYERALVEAKITLLQDPRVSAVKNQILNVIDTAIYLEADVVPINQSSSQRMAILLN